MPELLALQGKDKTIDIVKEIGVQWCVVGIHLLNDESGATIEAIDEQFRGNVQAINLEILKRWLRGEGLRDCTWRVLLGVLRKAHCVELAESVEEALTDEEAEQGKSNSHLVVGIMVLHLSIALHNRCMLVPLLCSTINASSANSPVLACTC